MLARQKAYYILIFCVFILAAKNGIYLNLVKDVRDAFDGSPLVKIDCQGLHASDYKKIGAKLMVCETLKTILCAYYFSSDITLFLY